MPCKTVVWTGTQWAGIGRTSSTFDVYDDFSRYTNGSIPSVAQSGQAWGQYSGPGYVTNGYYDSELGTGASYMEIDAGTNLSRMGARWKFDTANGTRTTDGSTLAIVTWGSPGIVVGGTGRPTSCHVTITDHGCSMSTRAAGSSTLVNIGNRGISPVLTKNVDHTAEVSIDYDTNTTTLTIDGARTFTWTDATIVKSVGENFACWEPSYTTDSTDARCRIGKIWAKTTSVTNPPVGTPSEGLWFALPSTIRTHEKKSFPHYFGPFPRSITNVAPRSAEYYATGFLTSNGEGGKHASYGGFLRNRHIYRAPLATDGRGWDYHKQDAEFEINAAIDAGHDGFFVDILGPSGNNWDRYVDLVEVASSLNNGFTIVPMLDMNGSTVAAGVNTSASAIAYFAGKNSSWYVDGKLVISSFKGEGQNAAWWQSLKDRLLNTHGIDTLFLASFLNYTQAANFSSVTWGEGSWAYPGDPGLINGVSNQTNTTHSRGKKYLMPVSGQNVRPNTSYGTVFDESCNTEAHRASWEKAIRENPDYVQGVTWSDFGEGGEIVPSEARGYAPLDLDAWYMTKWKTGAYPAILRDCVILSHRSNPKDSVPSGPQTVTMQHWVRGSGRSELRDTVEALTFLIAPAEVTITTAAGSTTYTAPAGMFARTVPLAVGAPPSVVVKRAGAIKTQVTSVVSVVASPYVDDKQYYWFSSLRGTAGQRVSVAQL